ncbi:TonB-dependent receptor [soil metagenome]
MKMTSTKGSVRARLFASTLLAGLATVAAPLAVTAIATAIPTLASAQDYSSGTLVGTVTDSGGAPVAGASVKVKSIAQGFERELTTNSDGQFRAALIPLGGYSVSISKPGYQSTSDGNVAVRLGGASNYGFSLSAEGEVGAVVVTASANPQLDFEGTTTGTVIDVETLVKQVPIARNVTALTLLAPSAVPGDSSFSAQGLAQASIAGSSVGENIFYVNGLNITNFVNGIGAALVPFDFYKTVEVKTGGFSAEFGRGTGGVVNAVTKSGSNTFAFAVHGNYEPKSLREKAPDTFQTANRLRTADYKDVVLEASGPIIEDHLFLYGLYQAPKSKVTTGAILGNYYGVTTYNDPVWGLKLDGYLTSRQHLELTYMDTSQQQAQQRYSYSNATGVIGAKTINQINRFGGPSWVGRYTGTFTDWLTVSAAYGKSEFEQAAFNSLVAEPLVQDNRAGTGARTISRQTVAAGTQPSISTREFYRADADIYFNLFGSHHVRGGYDHEENTFLNFSQRNGGQNWTYLRNNNTTVNALGLAPGQEYVSLRTFNGGGSFVGVNKAYYIQDSWDIGDRLSLNAGFRRDDFLEKDASGAAFSTGKNNKALRLGFSFDPTGDKQNKIFGYYGRFYLPVAANTAFRAASNNLDVTQSFLPSGGGLTFTGIDPLTGKTALGALIVQNGAFGTNLGACTPFFLSRGIVSVTPNVLGCATSASKGVPPPPESISALNVKSTMQDQYILGFEHRFNSLWKAKAVLSYNTLLRAADDAAIDGAVVAYCAANGYDVNACKASWSGLDQYLIVNPGKDVQAVLYTTLPGETTLRTVTLKAGDLGLPQVKREYTSLELSFERAFDGKWSLQGSYVLSESKGNFEGAVKSDTGQADAGITSDFDLPGFIPGAYGLLPNHHAHQFKLFGAYAVTDNLTIGGNASVIAPRHYGCQGIFPQSADPAGYGSQSQYSIAPAHYCVNPSSKVTELVPRGSRIKGDWINRLDLSVRYAVPTKFVPAGNLVLRADVFNILNSQGKQELYENGDVNQVVPGSADANYGKPGSSSGTVGSGYQTPRYVRFGFDLNF